MDILEMLKNFGSGILDWYADGMGSALDKLILQKLKILLPEKLEKFSKEYAENFLRITIEIGIDLELALRIINSWILDSSVMNMSDRERLYKNFHLLSSNDVNTFLTALKEIVGEQVSVMNDGQDRYSCSTIQDKMTRYSIPKGWQ
jgi:hypothetical protein